MKKRDFIRTLGLGAAAPFMMSSRARALAPAGELPDPVYPSLLKTGDTVGLISPSAAIAGELPFQLAVETFEALGFRVKTGKHIRERFGHLAGHDEQKLEDLHGMFADPDVKAVICLRGGSGAARLLPKLDYDLIAENPKIFLGYSDITALHCAIHIQTGLITFHGPMGTSQWPSLVAGQFDSLFVKGELLEYKNPVHKGDDLIPRSNRTLTITPGVTSGRLLGGNLTVLTGIAGSAYYPDFEGSILFLEDIGEQLYRVERMFSQLKLSGTLDKLKGLIFGKCSDCDPGSGYGSLTLDEILDDYIKPLGIPAYQGALIGHIREQFILPVGARVEMNAGEGTFRLTEQAAR